MQAQTLETGQPVGTAPRSGQRQRPGWARLVLRQPAGLIGTLLLAAIVLCALLAFWLSPQDPTEQVLLDALLPPGPGHPLGTDELGRDILSRVLYGARASLEVGVVAVSVSAVLGTMLGQVAGFRGGRTDEIVMRIMDALLTFPALMLALIINTILGASLTNAIIAIAVVTLPGFARLARGATLATREQEFVQAARLLGASDTRVLGRHILPNILAPLIVNVSNQMSAAIITEGSLSFLGLGVQPPQPSWGSMLRTGYSYMDTNPLLAVAPGVAVMVTVLAFNFLGDALQEVFDPRLRNQRV